MFPRQWHISVTIAFLAIVAFASASPGYLATVGPASLRFRAPAKRFVEVAPSSTPAATRPSPPLGGAENVPVSFPDFNPLNMALPDVAAPELAATNAVPETPQPEESVSPQMLLKFFSKGTNNTAISVIAPVGFTPPRAGEPPSSKATYSTSP